MKNTIFSENENEKKPVTAGEGGDFMLFFTHENSMKKKKGSKIVFFQKCKKKMKIFFRFFSKKFSSRLSGGRGFLRLTLVLQF